MGKIQDFFSNIVGRNPVITEETLKQVEEISKLSKQLQKAQPQAVQKKEFISTVGGQQVKGNEAAPGKSYRDLRVLYSEAPGAVQCGNVIRNGILGGGFQIVPTDITEDINEKDPEYQSLAKFLAMPNKEETLEDIFSGMIQNYHIYGNAFIEKVFNGKVLEEVYNLNTEKMKILVDEEKKKEGIDIAMGYTRDLEDSRKKIKYELNEVMHLKRPDPNGSLYGQAVMENHTGVLAMVISALTYNVNIFRNQGKGPMQIILPAETSQENAEAFQAYYEKNYVGPANAGKTLVLYAGAEAKTLGDNLKDMDYINLLKFAKVEVAGMFGVPLVLISDPEGSNRAVSVEERKAFVTNNIIPEREKMLRKFNQEVLVDGLGITKYKLGILNIDTEDQGKLTTEAKEGLFSGLATPNEAMEYAGWETVKEEWADKKYIISGNSITPFEEALNIYADNKAVKDAIANAPEPAEDDEKEKPAKDEKEKPKDKKEDEKEKTKKAVTLNEIRQMINKKLGY